MSGFISKQDVKWQIQEWINELNEAIDMLDSIPSADEVEVVRCKDCKWYVQKQKNLPYNVTKRYCNRTCTLATKEDDYCSYGERREPWKDGEA